MKPIIVTSGRNSIAAQNMPRPYVPKQATTPTSKDLKRKLKDMGSLLEAAEAEPAP